MARRRKNGPTETDNLFALRCQVCGRCLVYTSASYLCCPAGHGKLIEAQDDPEPCGSWFDTDAEPSMPCP